ncbi:hypothetical protein P171DRAFT_196402 [Karstenula rhodostoma CBS 690.94]|uniref:Uncharacterized protein n=1 Tax=Karstenula rhodostoma CBS 690.94 TaxID=1392251 RepID=A0A9P4PVM3_9PLEO|nr:hypothetical protein P171DRAFT_196402 [Karstenula rhodostoma CBS 690.94]
MLLWILPSCAQHVKVVPGLAVLNHGAQERYVCKLVIRYLPDAHMAQAVIFEAELDPGLLSKGAPALRSTGSHDPGRACAAVARCSSILQVLMSRVSSVFCCCRSRLERRPGAETSTRRRSVGVEKVMLAWGARGSFAVSSPALRVTKGLVWLWLSIVAFGQRAIGEDRRGRRCSTRRCGCRCIRSRNHRRRSEQSAKWQEVVLPVGRGAR